MKKSLVALEYFLKIAAVGMIWLLGMHIDWVAEPYLMLAMLAWIFPPLWAVYAAAAYVLWALPIAPRGNMGFAKKWFAVPLLALGCVAAAVGACCLAAMGYNLYQYHKVTAEINAFVERADERLVYINAVDPAEYPGGVYKSVVDVSSVYIDYDKMEVAFVFYDWSFADQFRVYKLRQTENKTEVFDDFYGNHFIAPFVADNSKFQSIAALNKPGAMLYSYYPEGYSERLGVNYISESDTNAIAIVMDDDTLWTVQFEDTDLDLSGNILGMELCHEDELNQYE